MKGHATLSKGISINTIQGKRVLFSLRNGETFGLNDTAAVFLEELLVKDFDAAVTTCATRFDAPREEIRADMTELVGELSNMGLIVVRA